MNTRPHHGFTIIELLIVILVISILLAIAVPSYNKFREDSRKNACIVNLRQINSAIDQWALDNKIATGTVPSSSDEEDIYAYLKGNKPKCPGGGTYTIHAVGVQEQVTCSLTDKEHRI